MRVFMTGATGFVGRHLALRLRRDGHQIVAWVRDRDRARDVLGADPELVAVDAPDEEVARVLSGCDAVINLAGAPVARRWTEAHRRAIVDSRVGLTRRLVGLMGRASRSPEVLVSTSAVGFYGDRGDEVLDEDSGVGQGFLPRTSEQWEAAARAASSAGTRVAILRLGVVLGPEGGALASMLPPFRAGLGGPIAGGKMFMSWIHLDDVLELFVHALETDVSGVVNGVTGTVPNAVFTKTLARVLGRPAVLPVPALALRLMFGDGARVLTDSLRVRSRRHEQVGFEPRHVELEEALRHILDGPPVSIRPAAVAPSHPYLERRPVTHVLEQSIVVDHPLDEVFPFFSRAENLGALTPPGMAFQIQTPLPIPMKQGTVIDYRIRLGPLPMPWRTVIEVWEPGARFVDAQHRGPYRTWFHEHVFEAVDGGTRIVDRVHFAAPLGPLGRLATWLFVAPMLRRIFSFRARAIARRFGAVAADGRPTARAA